MESVLGEAKSPLTRVNVLLSRHAEIYSGNAPLDWLIAPQAARYDRKHAALEFDLPWHAVLRVCDGVEQHYILVGGEEQIMRLRAARLTGRLTCLET